jgi:hypothetical protein
LASFTPSSSSPTSWDPNANGTVRTITVSGSTIYVGGDFTSITGSTRNRIAAVSTTDGTVASWDPNANGTVRAIAVSGSTIYVGGDFTTFGSGSATTRNQLASFTSSSSTPTSWNPNANGTVYAIAVGGGKVYAGGQFTKIGVTDRQRLAAFSESTGELETAWDAVVGLGSVYALSLNPDASELIVGGLFHTIGASEMLRKNMCGIISASSYTGSGAVYSSTWKGSSAGDVYAIALSGSRFYVGSNGLSVGGQTRKYLACLKSNGTELTDMNAFMVSATGKEIVQSLAVDSSKLKLYVGGNFHRVEYFNNNTTGRTESYRSGLAAFDIESNPDIPVLLNWDPDFRNSSTQPNSPNICPTCQISVSALTIMGDNVYAGGSFSKIGTTTNAGRLAAFDRQTREFKPWDPDIRDGNVSALSGRGSMLYVGGNFTDIGGSSTYSSLAAFDVSPASPSLTSWKPGAKILLSTFPTYLYSPGYVNSLATSADGSKVFVGGLYSHIITGAETSSRVSLAAIDAQSGNATSWEANLKFEGSYHISVYSLLLLGNTLYVGGNFGILGTFGGSDYVVSNLGAVNITANTNNAISWNTGMGNLADREGTLGARSLAVVGSDLYVGGGIVSSNGTTSYLATYTPPSSVTVSWGGGSGGNWDERANWSPQVVPTSSTDAIQIALGYPVMNTHFTLGAASGTTKSLTISGTGSLEIAAGKRFSVAATGTANFGGNSVILRSSAAGTASIGEISGSLSGAGNVTVERYIPTGRKWRLLTAPLTGSTNTSIFYNWQRNGVSNGTHGVEIWAPGGSNGLTAGGAAASILSYSSGWQSLTNTNSTELFSSTTNNAYAVFVTGPYGSTNISSGAAATTLSATGTLITGDHTKSFSGATAGQYFLVGNPYASPVNPASFREDQGNRTNLDNALYLWDAKQTGTNNVGRYVTFNIDAGTYSIDGGESSVGYSNTPTITQIQSGQAFFVRVSSPVSTTPSIRFREANKTSTGSHEMLGNSTTENKRYVRVQLSRDSAILDGVVTFFEPDASAAVDAKDAVKMMNSSENLGLRRDGKTLVFEHRPELKSTDTLYIALTQMNQAAYRLSVRCYGVTVEDGVRMELVDTYTKLRKELSATQANEVEFMVDDQPASSGDRYLIVMTKKAAAAGTTTEPASSVKMKPYPNPVTGSSPVRIGIDSERAPWGIRVVDASGRTVWSRSGVDATEGQVEIDFSRLGSGVYNVVMTDARGRRSVSKVVKH